MATITQTVHFAHSPQQVFDALTDEAQHAAFTGEPASIDCTVGGTFSVYGDYATGHFTAIDPGRSFTQTWQASDWDDDQISTLTITLTPTPDGCTLTLTQTDVPDDQEQAIITGWQDWYWKPLAAYLDSK